VRYSIPKERISSLKEFCIRSIRGRLEYEEFSALKRISLNVERGESLGIVGRNGAGKTTLLKVITRVMKPVEGQVRVEGRISPLLELGAGFDVELTGRENVYLNGTVLGYGRKAMKEKFNRIVEFSELESFIDVPLRMYSSGMTARLAFAIAIDTEPEILAIDEVLEVGDASFMYKSGTRVREFCNSGATVLLVSHNTDRIRKLCSKVLWLDGGEIMALGNPEEVIQEYMKTFDGNN
jgi:ABC-type polysaccharide/polyol phosphate transport system ATPase subunit